MPNVEWSGTLFYTHEGSMEKGNLVITCRDIYVMDIGSAGYTEFDMSPDVIGYMAENPELLDMQLGLIHSHNTMSTFFSGTDTATLKEEGRDRNHFVSLIVNNAGSYTAAITRKLKSINTIQEVYEYHSFNDEVITGTSEHTEESEVIEYYMLDITKEGSNVSFKEIDARLDEIKKRKANRPKVVNNNAYKPLGRTIPEVFERFPSPKKGVIGSLFEDELEIPTVHLDPTDIESEPIRKIEEYDGKINQDDVNNVLTQLVTGSIVLRDYNSFDIDRWVNDMPKVFGKRFGFHEQGLKEYEGWADSFCEFLILNVEPDIQDGQEEAQWMSDFSESLRMHLESLPQNKYIETLKGITEQWIL